MHQQMPNIPQAHSHWLPQKPESFSSATLAMEDIPITSHSLKGDNIDPQHCVMDETQMRHTPHIACQHITVVTHHTLLPSSPPPSSTIPLHHPRSRNENSLETPPNAMSTQCPPPIRWQPTDANTNANGHQKLQPQPQPPGNWPKHQPGQLWMWGAHPTSNLTPPFVVKELGLHKMSKPSKDCSTIEPRQKTIHHRRRGSGGKQGGSKGPQPFSRRSGYVILLL